MCIASFSIYSCFCSFSYFCSIIFCEPIFCFGNPHTFCFGPFCKPFLLGFVYFPIAWCFCFAIWSIATCANAFSRFITYDERPNEERTSRADSCMLWLIKLRKVFSAIENFVYIFVNYFKFHDLSFKARGDFRGWGRGGAWGCRWWLLPLRREWR